MTTGEDRAEPRGEETKLREAMAQYDAAMALLGTCGDGNCVIKKPVGMHTNGGCHCYEDRTRARRAMQYASYFANKIRALLQAERSEGGPQLKEHSP